MAIGLIDTEADLERFIRDRVPATLSARYAETIGNGSSTTFTIEHRMGTRDITVTVYETSAPYAELPIGATLTAIEHTGADDLTLTFAAPPGSGAYRVVVQR